MFSTDPDIRRLMALRAVESGLLRLQWLAAATRFELALRRHDRALKHAYKAGFNPDQPRVPAGNPDGGQWTSEGGVIAASPFALLGISDGGAGTGEDEPQSSEPIRLAGDIPTGDSPEIPEEKPPTSQERSAALRAVARWLGEVGGSIESIAEVSAWVRTYSASIEAYRDLPKSLEELQQGVSTPVPGYDIHHIVEQRQAEEDGFTRNVINSSENLVRIPRMKHWEINGWYQRENPEFDWQTPREYLSGRNWDVRRAVGLYALKIHGVLKP